MLPINRIRNRAILFYCGLQEIKPTVAFLLYKSTENLIAYCNGCEIVVILKIATFHRILPDKFQ